MSFLYRTVDCDAEQMHVFVAFEESNSFGFRRTFVCVCDVYGDVCTQVSGLH